jgi:succinylglutamate desuccinylase
MSQPPRLSMSRDEIRAVYAEGEDAVIALVESLIARINQLSAKIAVIVANPRREMALANGQRVCAQRANARVGDKWGIRVRP